MTLDLPRGSPINPPFAAEPQVNGALGSKLYTALGHPTPSMAGVTAPLLKTTAVIKPL
jgi:hypothetical protein